MNNEPQTQTRRPVGTPEECAADTDFYERRLEEAQGGGSALGDTNVRRAVLSTSRTTSRANSPPLSPHDTPSAAGDKVKSAAVHEGDGKGTVSFDGGLSLPAALYDRLFPYQQVGVQWMWELHMQRTGGARPLLCH
jgi:hypothetical protein